MPMRHTSPVILIAVFYLASGGAIFAEAQTHQVPPKLAEILSGAQGDLRQGRPAEALRRLAGYQGSDHALRHLMMGHAYVRQSDHPAAITAYRAALRMDPKLAQAGLARSKQFSWQQAARETFQVYEEVTGALE